MREAATQQIANREKQTDKLFDGYGYPTWTNNRYAPNTYRAVGRGGQRIGWNTKNSRVVIVFSNQEDWMDDVYKLAKSWGDVQ
jgi:CubicO group peptidase (beta-lactamase class C family)